MRYLQRRLGYAWGLLQLQREVLSVFVWRQSDSIMEKFVKSLLDRRLEDLPSFCVEVIFNYLENTFFSEKWWVSLVEKQKSYVAQLATNSNPYYFENT
jgi:hypothetical protein